MAIWIILFLALYILGLFSLAWRLYQKAKKTPYQTIKKPNQSDCSLKKIYIICPVRKLNEKEKNKILDYVNNLEKQGHQVKCPFRDTNQNDEIGLRIVEEHTQGILWANEIHIWWNPNSEGSVWDLAQTYLAMKIMAKKLVLINPENIEITPHKSFTNVLIAIYLNLPSNSTLEDLKQGLENLKNKKAH